MYIYTDIQQNIKRFCCSLKKKNLSLPIWMAQYLFHYQFYGIESIEKFFIVIGTFN